MKPTVGPADALRVMATFPRDQWPLALAPLGFSMGETSGARAASDLAAARGADVRLRTSISTAASTMTGASLERLPLLPRRASGPPTTTVRAGAWLAIEQLDQGDAVEISPLYDPAQSSSLVAALLRAVSGAGEPDVDVIVDRVARRRSVSPVPRRVRRRLPSRVVVAVDTADTMRAYDDDLPSLFDAVEMLVSPDQVERVALLDDVLALFETIELERDDVVLVITDLGIPRLSSPDRRDQRTWCSLAERARDRGAHPVALVPYPSHRWPAGVAAEWPIVRWDRHGRVERIHGTDRVRRS